MSQRNTGRTTRMLEEAKRLCSEGREVYIIVANEYERLRIRKLLRDNPGISVETSYSPGDFDWDAMQLRGTNRNCVTLIDHYAIESIGCGKNCRVMMTGQTKSDW